MSEDNKKDQRPNWPFTLKEDDARWLLAHHINQIEHHWKFTSPDTSEEWLEFVRRADRDRPEQRRRFDLHIFNVRGVYWRPTHNGLIAIDNDLRKGVEAIDKFDSCHRSERAQYERLKAKFEG